MLRDAHPNTLNHLTLPWLALTLLVTRTLASSVPRPPPSLNTLTSLFSSSGHFIHLSNGSEWTPTNEAGDKLDRSREAWQPSSGCRVRRFEREEIVRCVEGERVVVWGDSTARVLFYGILNKLSPTLVTAKHENRVFTFPSIPSSPSDPHSPLATFEYRWDPVLDTNTYCSFRPFLEFGYLPPLNTSISNTSTIPPVIVFSTGLWYIDPRPNMYPRFRVPEWKEDVRRILEAAKTKKLARVVVIAEVEVPTEKDDLEVHPPEEAREMNRWLREVMEERMVSGEAERAVTPVVYAPAFNAMIANLSASTGDGLHYSMDVAEEQADLVMNAICSSRLADLPADTCGLEPVASQARADGAVWIVSAVAVVLLSAVLLRRRKTRTHVPQQYSLARLVPLGWRTNKHEHEGYQLASTGGDEHPGS
ncbi:hypothetical protein NBRC10513v2_007330 [Rhodotorula toruloides]|uniref:BY PROTMAP: gi/472585619/gb/EMS23170.1/ O-acetyltransferase [Rhodosporidium toruloides NP11] gi/647400695/emb/CDR46374.1/ RHTO0S12e03818g1_1 [Rhodosporidium toruloides] n=1 Tax=Rhodotorula toruloides TaxID=5286 RepID=A0A0K3CTX8_RHOTO